MNLNSWVRCAARPATGAILATLVALVGQSPVRAADDPPRLPPAFTLSWGGKGAADGQFQSPIDIAVNEADELYVTEFHGQRVQKFTAEGQFLLSFPVADHPGGIAVDRQGNVYVAPLLGHQVRVFAPDGRPLRSWGRKGTGDGEFNEPGDIAIDRQGNVYVTDQVNRRVQWFDAEGRFLGKWGEYGSEPGQFDGLGKPDSRIGGPQFLAFDRAGFLYTTEALLGRIQKWTPEGKYLAHWGHNRDEPGGFGGRENRAVSNPFPGPIALCFDAAGRVWVSSTNNRVQQFTADGQYLTGFGGEGSGPGQFLIPHGIAIDRRGDMYVVDSGNHRVQKFSGAPRGAEAPGKAESR